MRTVMVVEDNPEFALLVSEAITCLGSGWATCVFHSGREAISALTGTLKRVDLLLVDLGLPDISGHEVIRAGRQLFPDAPVMVISVLGGAESVLNAIKLGACGYVQKGDSALSLTEAVRGVLEGKYPISPSLAHHLFRLAQTQAPALDDSAEPLTTREIDLLRLLGQGYTYDEAAQRLGITLNTAQSYSKRIYQKLEVRSKSAALAAARQRGVLP